MNTLSFRNASREDINIILDFIKMLAKYEKMENDVVATPTLLNEWLFEKNIAEVIFAVMDGKEIGFALYFHNFSTFVGKAGLYLEDIFILPEHRGKGYGKAMFRELVKTARDRGCGRMEWCCLDWNKPSIDFYISVGAKPLSDWTIYRLSEQDFDFFLQK